MPFAMQPNRNESFGAYLDKKQAEEKYYNIALSHATNKLVQLIYTIEKSGQLYNNTA
jgi:hypothetical protein